MAIVITFNDSLMTPLAHKCIAEGFLTIQTQVSCAGTSMLKRDD
ncbi:MAG: hypothetical protein HLUCCO02_05700 [Idiomarinaceae bacterium HL-53]|nr:MAG: hypothetical protein HLUCCO02_05700 [Idiomarinaceae bacterium HL-53]CUS48048.1 hypothetical protein Ga0003345_0987 [Idiomarinaceae bacterium HL-53]